MPESDRLLAEQFWIANTEVSPNSKDVIRLRKEKSQIIEHMIHRQYRTNEAIHLSFLQESGVLKMSRTVFDDCKPWFVKPGKVDTCLCKVCEDFRLAKKAATYNYELLSRPYNNLRIIGRFLFAGCTTLKMMKRKYGGYREYEKIPETKRMLPFLFKCVRQVEVSCRRPLCIHELCSSGMSMDNIVENVLCRRAMPTGDYIGKPCCYCECSKESFCASCIGPKGVMRRVYRNIKIENSVETGGWSLEDRMVYTTYSNKKGEETSQMSLLYEVKVHPSKFMDHFADQLGEYCKHIAKLRRQKHAHKEQDRNFLPEAITVDIDFSQNFVYTDRINAIQSDHWKSSSTTLFVAVLRYLRIATWNQPPVALKKGQSVSIIKETNDGGGDVYVYGELDLDQDLTGGTISVRHPGMVNAVHYLPEEVKVREVVSVPLIVVSDSKLHDTYFVRYFLSETLLGESGWLKTQTREEGLSQRIRTLHICSDGAAAHFKQRGSLHYITGLSVMSNYNMTWTFGCPGHGKGTWDGLGGIIKNKTGHYLKAEDIFVSSAKEVFDIIYALFASDKAQARFDANPSIKIKEWKILWLPDSVIGRPPAQPKKNGKPKKGKEKEDEGVEDDEVGERNKFSPLKAFHNVGTRGIFYYKAEHRDGFSVRLSACHCSYCIRDYHANGMGTLPTGCLSKEGYQYLICQRLDEEWLKEKESLMAKVSLGLVGLVKVGNIVAITSFTLLQGSSNSIHASYDICRIVQVNDDNTYNVHYYVKEHNSMIYTKPTNVHTVVVPQSKIRYIVQENVVDVNERIVLDSFTVEIIVKTCFNGSN